MTDFSATPSYSGQAPERTTAERVRTIVADNLGKDLADVTPETTFEQLEADSLDVLDALLAIDKAFDVDLDETRFNHTSTVGDMIAAVEQADG